MKKENFTKIFLMALSEPEYARIDFWKAEEKKSKYSKKNFVRKLIEAHDNLLHRIERKEAEFKALNPDAGDPNFGLPLMHETDHALTGHVKKTDLDELLISIHELAKSFNLIDEKKSQRKKYPFEKRKEFWNQTTERLMASMPKQIKNGIIDIWIHDHCKKEMPIKWHAKYGGLEPQLCYERLIRLKECLNIYLEMPELKEVNDIILKGMDDVDKEIEYLKSQNFGIKFYQKLFDVDRTYPVLLSEIQSTQKDYVEPINWLKSKELLRLLFESLKKQELIEEKNTEDIINEHFRVNKKNPTKKPQPIVWLAQVKLLPYLMDQLSQERFIEVRGAKHKLTASHFVNESGDPLNASSLGSMLSLLKKEVRTDDYVVRQITTVMNNISDNS